MSRCILFGHTPVSAKGHGVHASKIFDYCADCGLTLASRPADPDTAPVLPNPFTRLEPRKPASAIGE